MTQTIYSYIYTRNAHKYSQKDMWKNVMPKNPKLETTEVPLNQTDKL